MILEYLCGYISPKFNNGQLIPGNMTDTNMMSYSQIKSYFSMYQTKTNTKSIFFGKDQLFHLFKVLAILHLPRIKLYFL